MKSFFVGCKSINLLLDEFQIKSSEIMEAGARVHIPVSVAEMKISRRFDTIPSGTLYPNADEIKYLQRLVKYKVSIEFNLHPPLCCLRQLMNFPAFYPLIYKHLL